MVLSTSAPTSLNLDQQIMDFVAHSILWRWNSSCKILCNIVIQWRHSNKFYSKFLQRAIMMKNTIGPTQVKCGLLISDIFYLMNFRLFLEMLEFNSWHFWKMSEIHCIKNARNQKSTFDLRWALDINKWNFSKIHKNSWCQILHVLFNIIGST